MSGFYHTLLVLLQLASASVAQTDATIFNPPALKPILHVVPIIDYPTNVTDLFTVTARVQNLGGEMPP